MRRGDEGKMTYTDAQKRAQKVFRQKHRKRLAINYKRWYEKLKLKVLSHYSHKRIPECANCGYKDIRALSIDHINGKGAEHRRSIGITKGGGGWRFYYWLKKNNYPKGYQVLCMNCQFIKRVERHEVKNK
jgi:hypothetical protein